MRQLAITGFCTVALLSGCGKPEPKVVANKPDIMVPCNGKDYDSGEWPVEAIKQTVVFHTDGRCNFAKVDIDPPKKQFTDPVIDPTDRTKASSDYDGTPITYPPGYKFKYDNDYPPDGNGSGVIKNPKK